MLGRHGQHCDASCTIYEQRYGRSRWYLGKREPAYGYSKYSSTSGLHCHEARHHRSIAVSIGNYTELNAAKSIYYLNDHPKVVTYLQTKSIITYKLPNILQDCYLVDCKIMKYLIFIITYYMYIYYYMEFS